MGVAQFQRLFKNRFLGLLLTLEVKVRNSDAQKLKCFAGKPSSDAEHPDYVPSIFASMKNKGSSSSVNRYNRQVKRREVWNAPLTEIENEPPILKLDTKEVDCQTDLTFQEISKVPFVSKLYGGRTSDKQIIQLSGFLEPIRPGDVIFADRGFPVKDLVAERGASLVLPASTKGKKQLSSAKVINSRKVSRLRVHIERCIGRLKTFRILKSLWPISFVNNKTSEETCIGDDVIFVVAALCNILKGRLIRQM
ncbi:putative isl2eu-5 hm [Trichonephila clavipes]|nr:putative isl2eu-5 hm [Trichonephila clavipes]